MKRYKSRQRAFSWPAFAGLLLAALLSTGCWSTPENSVVVYAALDKEFSEPILEQFADEHQIDVIEKYDTESNKTVGLANEIIQSRNRPRADLFWNNEILHTIRLQKEGLLETYRSPLADQYPSQFVSPESQWHGFAARARVLIINTDLLPERDDWPDSVNDLADEKWAGQCGMARPLFGTTATHAAVLFASWGEDRAKMFLETVAVNAKIEGGNKQVALNVARGQLAWGITDTDDAIIEVEKGGPVAIVFPDQNADQIGTLFIPNTLCIIKNGPNPERAKKLVDYLLQADVEAKLAECSSAQIPLNRNGQVKSRVEPDSGIRKMEVDFTAAAEQWESAKNFVEATFPIGGNK